MQSNLIWVEVACTMYARMSVTFLRRGSRGVLLKISYECINCRRVRDCQERPLFRKSVLQVAAIYWVLFALTKDFVKPLN